MRGLRAASRLAGVNSEASEADEAALLHKVASAQQGSEHPLARAVIARAGDMTLSAPAGFTALPGRGLEATVDGERLFVGSRRLMVERGVDLGALDGWAREQESQGLTVMWAATASGDLLGCIAAGDAIRPESAEAVARLKAAHLEPVMLTGDNAATAQVVAAQLGIERVVAEVLPADKAAQISALRGDGRVVAMVGDGVNDAPALAAADVSFAMATGSDVAMHTAAITLMRSDPRLVADAIAVSRATTRKIKQNLFWAFVYNLIGIPLAALGLLTPVLAGGAMALSSVSVLSNSLLLHRWRPRQ